MGNRISGVINEVFCLLLWAWVIELFIIQCSSNTSQSVISRKIQFIANRPWLPNFPQAKKKKKVKNIKCLLFLLFYLTSEKKMRSVSGN